MNKEIAVAPMMGYTDRHFRYLMRLITRHALLYTEMLTVTDILEGDRRHLHFDPLEHPLAIQLGGSEPSLLTKCAMIAEDAGYDEVNLNIGCPSHRVQQGRIGACLMKEPDRVSACVAAIKNQVSLPVTIKCRLGIDDQDSYQEFAHFIARVASSGCDGFIVHARKAWLTGLNPKQNRNLPPLRYEYVYQIKKDFPKLKIILNGGIKTMDEIFTHLNHVDGVMVGREAYQNPYMLSYIDSLFYADDHQPSPSHILDRFIPYVERELSQGVKLSRITRGLMGLFRGVPGASQWRKCLSGCRGSDAIVAMKTKAASLFRHAP